MKKRSGLLSIIIITSIAFITYGPALKIQFYDGWWYLIWSATMDLPRFLIQFLDPANITQGYRPIQGLYIYLIYHLVGFNPDGYHLAQNLLHTANAVLLFSLVERLARNRRLAFVTACIYAVLPNYSLAVFWHAVVDPLAGFFYLLTLLLWTRFLETKARVDFGMTFMAFIFALLSKEIAIFLPLFMFLIEWWFYGEKPSWRVDVPRYTPFLLSFVPYLYQVYQVQSHGEFVGQFGFKLGLHMLNNLIPYMAVLSFPWIAEFPTAGWLYVWSAIAVVVYAGIMVYKRSTVLLFLGLFAVLNISPLLGFPQDYFNTRYLYLPTIVSAVVLAMIFEALSQILSPRRLQGAIALVVVGVILASSGRVADASDALSEYTRQVRVPFRDISRAHPAFAPDTYLYFIYSPLATYWDFEGLFFSRYGTQVKVDSTELGKSPELHDHAASYVYYFDSTGKPIELAVDQEASPGAMPSLPVKFSGPIRLEKYQVPSTHIPRGKALVVVLDWSTETGPGGNYTVFAHLVDSQGRVIGAYDSQPRRGQAPTSRWVRGRPVVDAVVIPIETDAPLGNNYHLELGMYDPANMQRLGIVDGSGQMVGDRVNIGPFSIIAQE